MKEVVVKNSLVMKRNLWLLSLLLILVVSTISMCMIQRVSLVDGCWFDVFIIFFVFIPGLAFLKFAKLRFDLAMTIGMSLFAGLAIVVFQYFFVNLLKINDFSCVIALGLTIFSLLYLIKEYKREKNTEPHFESDNWMLPIFLIGILTVMLICGSANAMLPTSQQDGCYYVDYLWWTQNALSAAKGLPMNNFRVYGATFHYHYFSSIFVAYINMVMKIDIVNLCLYFSSIFSSTLLTFALFSLFKSYLRPIYIYIAMSLATLTDGIWQFWFFKHAVYIVGGNEYAIPGAILAILCIWRSSEKKGEAIRLRLIACVFIAILTGIKTPVGFIALVALAVAILFDFAGKEYFRALLSGVIGLVAFLIVFVFIVSGVQNIGIKEEVAALDQYKFKFWSISDYVLKGWVCGENYDNLVSRIASDNELVHVFCGIIAFFKTIISINVPVMIGSFAAIILLLRRKKLTLRNVSCIVLILTGLFFIVFMEHPGNSQRYFMYPMIPFAVLLCAEMLQELKGIKGRILKVCYVALVLIGVFYWQTSMRTDFLTGLSSIKMQKNWELLDTRHVLSWPKYQAYLWMRDNLKKTSVLAIDKYESGESAHLLCSTFSELPAWNDAVYEYNIDEQIRRSFLMDQIRQGKYDVVSEIRDEGVTHIVQNCDIDPDFMLPEEYGTIVYSNGEIVIWEL